MHLARNESFSDGCQHPRALGDRDPPLCCELECSGRVHLNGKVAKCFAFDKPLRSRAIPSSIWERGVKQRCFLRFFAANLCSPLDDRAGPSEAAAKDDEQDVVALRDPPGAIGFVEGDGDRRRAGVAVTLKIDENPIR